jgi:hypothetical protein
VVEQLILAVTALALMAAAIIGDLLDGIRSRRSSGQDGDQDPDQ